MRLFKLENYKLNISEEALCIKAFADLWKRDKTKNKSTAILELGLIFFMYDPRSDYMYIVDEEERFTTILEQEGLSSTYTFDKKMEAAVEVYKSLINTPSTLLLEDAKGGMEKVRLFLKDVDLNKIDDKGKPVYQINQITSALKDIPILAQRYEEALKFITLELEENSKIRGQKTKSMFEDGFQD